MNFFVNESVNDNIKTSNKVMDLFSQGITTIFCSLKQDVRPKNKEWKINSKQKDKKIYRAI